MGIGNHLLLLTSFLGLDIQSSICWATLSMDPDEKVILIGLLSQWQPECGLGLSPCNFNRGPLEI